MRFDKILINEGLAGSSQIEEALAYQKQNGGRLETHLFRLGYVDEERLLRALSIQFRCRSIKLSGIEIAESVLKSIPADLAWSKLVLPFDYNPNSNILKVACENPADKGLNGELAAVASGKTIELHVALGVILKCAIIKYYRSEPIHEITDDSPALLIQSELAAVQKNGRRNRVLIFNEENEGNTETLDLERNLNKQGYDIIMANSIDQLTECFIQNRPDILLLIKSGCAEDVSGFIDNLTAHLVIDGSVPVFLIPDPQVVWKLSSMLKIGIEDVIPIEDEYEPLVIKMNRLRDRREAESKQLLQALRDLGTHGSLEDMNVIDLLQTMGPSKKTARVSIMAHGKQLTIYLDKGNIIFAECDDKSGADAVYQGLSWHRGVWSIDQINPEDLPEPNNFQPNESILLEGCRLLDEQQATAPE